MGNDESNKMVTEKTWAEFRESGLLWWINMILHTFGWAICLEMSTEHEIARAYPARVKFRGFDPKLNDKGYIKVSDYLKENIDDLCKESKE